ncbi:DUF6461 domain-containing protein [Symbioplanes lichenis]|uniref:DUF6461 domain-containing protein n=1 Tax=Symbioplanes lichenis TaxID=1629072 RepID=UPI00273A250C|nr:DUF6461 domain-containing protein [Actinoplanes lichenis]
MDTAWAWVTESWYPGFCLTFVRDRDPATVAERLGGGAPVVMTVEQTGDVYPPHQRGSLLRLGTVPGWTYCYEDRAPVAFLPTLLHRLSAGTEVIQVVKGGDGMNIARRLSDGRLLEQFEPGRTATAAGPDLLLPRVERLLSDQPGTSPLLATLTAVSELIGAAVDRETLDGPLLTAFSTFTEPAAAATPRPSAARHQLGRRLGTVTPPQPRPE